MIIDLLLLLVGVVIGSAVSSMVLALRLLKLVMSKKIDEMEHLPVMPLGKRDTLDAHIRSTWNQGKKEEGEVVMPDRADVIKRDNLKIDDLLQ